LTSAIVLAAVDMISVVAIAALVQEEGAQGTTFTSSRVLIAYMLIWCSQRCQGYNLGPSSIMTLCPALST